ncbi:hypothetical protein BGZ49_001886, partial [Haplosporangium sp. Z 27]
EEVESAVQDGVSRYDGYLSRLVGASPTEDALALKRMVAPVLSNNSKLAGYYKPLLYSGDLLFFRATVGKKAYLIDPACWRPYIGGSIEAHDVECAHVEMDKPEHIAVIGRIVAACIEKLQ